MSKLHKTLGGDVSGVVVEVAPGTTDFKPQDRVFACTDGYKGTTLWGTYAEYVCVPTAHLAKIPDDFSFQDAAAMPLVSLTAWQALEAAKVVSGNHVLVHAGAGGVGSAAIQLAKQRGCTVSTTASPENTQYLKDLGADTVIDYKSQRFEEVCERPVHCVIDCVGGDYERRSLQLLDRSGWFVNILANPSMLRLALGKLRGLTRLGPHYHVMLVQPNGKQLEGIAELWKAGKVRPIVQSTFALSEAAEAHKVQETHKVRGKIVLNVAEL